MISFGIMQGRLTPSNGRGIQFFPFENWHREFESCSNLGLDEIEWIFDYDRYEENPLWTSAGTVEIKNVISSTRVKVRSVCFDYFMRRPFYKSDANDCGKIRDENLSFAKRIIDSMGMIGASLLEIPLVDDSSVKTVQEKEKVIDFLRDVLEIAKAYRIMVGCETDMPVGEFRSFLNDVDDIGIRANYDSGNSSGLGYDHEAEILSLDKYISNVHIKDRMLHGMTVALGTGSANFDKVFSSLKTIDYNKSILLQAARGEDGDELNNIKKQMEFVRYYCQKYGLE